MSPGWCQWFCKEFNDTCCVYLYFYLYMCINFCIFILAFCALVFSFVFVSLCLKRMSVSIVMSESGVCSAENSNTYNYDPCTPQLYLCFTCICIGISIVFNTHFHLFSVVFVLLCLKRSVSCRKVALALQRSPTHLIMIHVCRNCIYILLVFVWVFPLYLNTHFHSFSFVFVLFCLKGSVTCRKVALALQRILSPFDTLWHTLTHLHFDET